MTSRLARKLARRFSDIELPGNFPKSKLFDKAWKEFIEGRAILYWNSATGCLQFGIKKKK